MGIGILKKFSKEQHYRCVDFVICKQRLRWISSIIKGGLMDIQHIGRNIARLRVSRGLSQGDLGKEIGLTPSAISNIENAISYPSVDTLIRCC